ncbi:uncharacterized protein METZ01_LOCUS470225 [marine metagenome]|jgi:hypothetical protein|uniref:Uncharacterized protein n=1 Tax=marine metagenome TaxID=408172 RepID=A0A383BC24_9ZZZZ
MAVTTAVCNSFKTEVLEAEHDFGVSTQVYKIALYLTGATINKSTTSYGTTQESSGTNYTAGGKKLAVASQLVTLETDTACVDFGNVSWETATITAKGAVIYNFSSSTKKKAVCVLNFGGNKTSTAGTFTVQFPAVTDTQAILRIA